MNNEERAEKICNLMQRPSVSRGMIDESSLFADRMRKATFITLNQHLMSMWLTRKFECENAKNHQKTQF